MLSQLIVDRNCFRQNALAIQFPVNFMAVGADPKDTKLNSFEIPVNERFLAFQRTMIDEMRVTVTVQSI